MTLFISFPEKHRPLQCVSVGDFDEILPNTFMQEALIMLMPRVLSSANTMETFIMQCGLMQVIMARDVS